MFVTGAVSQAIVKAGGREIVDECQKIGKQYCMDNIIINEVLCIQFIYNIC